MQKSMTKKVPNSLHDKRYFFTFSPLTAKTYMKCKTAN